MQADIPENRTPTDGYPYYCAVCGVGLAEFLSCEEIMCEMESKNKAKERRLQHLRSKG